MAKPLPYSEGTLFSIPLGNGRFGAGIVARTASRGKIILIYLFRHTFDHVPNVNELAGFGRDDTIFYRRAGDLHLLDGRWRILGQSVNWNRDDWSNFVFIRKEGGSDRQFLVKYDDRDIALLLNERLVPCVPIAGAPDVLCGAGLIEKLLFRELGQIE